MSTCQAFRYTIAHGHQNLHELQDGEKVRQDDSIWLISNVSVYLEAKVVGDLCLTMLANKHLVSSNMEQNDDPAYAIRHLLSYSDFMCHL